MRSSSRGGWRSSKSPPPPPPPINEELLFICILDEEDRNAGLRPIGTNTKKKKNKSLGNISIPFSFSFIFPYFFSSPKTLTQFNSIFSTYFLSFWYDERNWYLRYTIDTRLYGRAANIRVKLESKIRIVGKIR